MLLDEQVKPRAARRTRDANRGYLTPAGVAQYCSVSRARVFAWLREGRESGGARGLWPQFRPSPRVVLVRTADVDSFVERFLSPSPT